MLIWNITTQTALLDEDDFVVLMPVFAEAQGNNFMVYVSFNSDERYKEVLRALNAAIRERHKIAFGHIVDAATNCVMPIYEILQSFWNDEARACEFEAQLVSHGSCELRRHDGSVTVSNVLALFDVHRTSVLINARVGHLDVVNIIEEWYRQEDGWRGVVTIEMRNEQAARQLVTDAKQLRAGCEVRIDYRSGLYEVSSVKQERNRIDITLHLKKVVA